MALTLDEIKTHMIPHEGNVSFMYLDKIGKVTVGIGNMLPSVASAQALPFVDRTTKNLASADQIKTDFESVAKRLFPQPFVYYKEFTALELTNLSIATLFQTRVDGFISQLKSYFPGYEKFPDPAQLALLDMAFNLGGPALNTRWPALKKAVLAQDWLEAEQQCNRTTCRAGRNEATKALFRDAAAQASAAASKP